MPPAVNPAYNVNYITGNTPATHRASLDASPGGPLATAPHHWVPKALPKIFYEPRADNTYHVSSSLLEYCCAPFFEILGCWIYEGNHPTIISTLSALCFSA